MSALARDWLAKFLRALDVLSEWGVFADADAMPVAAAAARDWTSVAGGLEAALGLDRFGAERGDRCDGELVLGARQLLCRAGAGDGVHGGHAAGRREKEKESEESAHA
jgi:hypothetical protein